MHDQVAQNKRRALVLAASFAAIVAVALSIVLFLLVGVLGVVVAILVGVGAAAALWLTSDGVALRASGAVPADPVTFARLHNLVAGLCIASGLPEPRLFVIDDVAPNALAVGRSPQHASLVVTTGLLDRLDRVELEGVLAHELSQIKNHDTVVATLAVTVLRFAPQLLPQVLGPRRSSLADLSAVEMTRFPPGLISALEKLEADTTVVGTNPRAIAHLWIEPPVATDPPLHERIATLREL